MSSGNCLGICDVAGVRSQMSEVLNMDLINKIVSHPLYQEQYAALQAAERDRRFCNHNLQHFLDVARLMYIYALEDRLPRGHRLSRELIYATALLHDIGRYEQISTGRGHHEAGADLAAGILKDCGAEEEFVFRVTNAILKHRTECKDEDILAEYLYRADKASRCCFICEAKPECRWPDDKKNLRIER